MQLGLRRSRFRNVLSMVLLIIIGVLLCYPLVWMFFNSFKSNSEIFTSLNLLPREWLFDAFERGWGSAAGRTNTFGTYFWNTFVLTVPTTLFTVASSAFVAYGFARFQFPGKRIMFALLLGTLMLPASILIIPRYTIFLNFNILNTYWPFYLLAIFACYPFFTYMMVQFLRGIPRELDEAALIDGCGSFGVLTHILLPLLKPALFSAGVFQFLWTYNDFFNANIIINRAERYPVSLGLRMLMGGSEVATDWRIVMAMSCLVVLPVIALFFACQKYFVEGIATTGLKG